MGKMDAIQPIAGDLSYQGEAGQTKEPRLIAARLRTHPELFWMALFGAAWGLLFLLRNIPVGGEWSALEQGTVNIVLLWVGAVVLGMAIGAHYARRRHAQGRRASLTAHDAARGSSAAIMLSSIAAATGALLIILEFAFVRGYGFSTPVANIRILEVTRGMAGADSSLLSGPGRLMLPAFLPAFLLVLLFWRVASKVALVTFVFATLVVLVEQIVFEGGRLFLGLVVLSLAIAVAADMMRIGWPPDWRRSISQILIVVVFSVSLVTYSAWVFSSRISGAGETQTAAFDRFSSALIEKDTHIAPVLPETQEERPPATPHAGNRPTVAKDMAVPDIREGIHPPQDPNPGSGAIIAKGAAIPKTDAIPGAEILPPPGAASGMQLHPTIKFFWIYATHGISQLEQVLRHPKLTHTHGFFQFPQIAQIADKVFKTSLRVDYYNNMPSSGFYTTMIGASVIDFGHWGSVLFALLFGWMIGFCAVLRTMPFRLSANIPPVITFSALAFPALMTTAIVSPVVSLANHMWPTLLWAMVACLVARFVNNNHHVPAR